LSGGERIALVIVWFGPLPFWMPAFLLSCRHNPGVDWMIFSDAPPPPGLPDNVRFLPLALEAFNSRASQALGFEVRLAPSYAYKMCDLKIMYGRIFEEELRGHDFWGCCDMDVVWGAIRSFITGEVLAGHDVITSRVGRISGHFCLFRNRPEWSTLYARIPDVAGRVAQADRYTGIDENGLTDLLRGWLSGRFRRFWAGRLKGVPLPRVYWDRVLTTSGKHQRQMLADATLRMRWRDGRTYGVHGEEMMYLHFHSIRKAMRGIDFSAEDPPREFTIAPEGFRVVREGERQA
jgi:hypothetical protein